MKIVIEIDSHKIATHTHRRDMGAELRGVLERLCNDLKRIEHHAPLGDFEGYAAVASALVKGLELKDDNGDVCGSCKGEGDFL